VANVKQRVISPQLKRQGERDWLRFDAPEKIEWSHFRQLDLKEGQVSRAIKRTEIDLRRGRGGEPTHIAHFSFSFCFLLLLLGRKSKGGMSVIDRHGWKKRRDGWMDG
jgi:hypothetical protein